MHILSMFFSAILQVLLVGVIVGAGLPALFSLGIKSLAYGTGGEAEVDHAPGHPIGKLVAYLCFALVIASIAVGIAIVVSSGLGYRIDFSNIIPVFQKK
ncbi:hypothetical protein GCM10027030_15150 [Luteococcus sediminum]|uniref:hypothetical protein n=1 Tax=Luteococcus sp. TaxID=1969402 RepID=UPI003735AEAB